jgi:hypothetical protein
VYGVKRFEFDRLEVRAGLDPEWLWKMLVEAAERRLEQIG